MCTWRFDLCTPHSTSYLRETSPIMSTVEHKDGHDHLEKSLGVTEETTQDPPSEEWQAASRRIVRKLDMTLMPIAWILYVFNYLDRNNIA